jgi:hypothetical protein
MQPILTDNTKIGILCCSLGALFLLLGIMFFFDSGLLAIGNILFLVGIPLIIGWGRTLGFFIASKRRRGAICFFLGMTLILFRWAFVGMLVELVGFVELFATFLPMVASIFEQTPYVGTCLRMPVVRNLVDFIAGRKAERRAAV